MREHEASVSFEGALFYSTDSWEVSGEASKLSAVDHSRAETVWEDVYLPNVEDRVVLQALLAIVPGSSSQSF